MKKILLFAAVGAMAVLSGCSKKAADTNPEAIIVGEETDSTVTVDVLTQEEGSDSAVQVDVVTLPKFDGVATLDATQDNLYRPNTKVDVLTVLDFNATWCGPCKKLHPVFEAAAKKYDNVRFVSIDIDQLPATRDAFNVQSVPTVVILNPAGGNQTFVGTGDLLPAEKFDAIITNALK